MNYLREINAFHERLNTNPLPGSAVGVWNALMHLANRSGWQEKLTIPLSLLCLHSGLSLSSVKRGRERLKKEGMVTWRSRGSDLCAVYVLRSCIPAFAVKADQQTDRQTDRQADKAADRQLSRDMNRDASRRKDRYLNLKEKENQNQTQLDNEAFARELFGTWDEGR